MEITDSSISLNARAQRSETVRREDRFTFEGSGFDNLLARSDARLATAPPAAAREDEDGEARRMLEKIDQLRAALFASLIAMLQGRPSDQPEGDDGVRATTTCVDKPAPRQVPTPAGAVGVSWSFFERREVTEQLELAARGTVRDAEGREMAFSLDLRLSRSETLEMSGEIRVDRLRDPLVLDLAGKGPAFSDERFAFDLDGDGLAEHLPFAAPGCAFLVADHDGDGEITEPGELFGARTGQAFRELAAWDDDGNGWIDAADGIWDRLRLWQIDGEGRRTLDHPAGHGVAAVALDHVAAPFDFRNDGDELLARMQAAGLFLRRDGTAGLAGEVLLNSAGASAGPAAAIPV